MINFVCVNWGLKFKPLYVQNLYNMVQRHLKVPHKFILFTDRPIKFRNKPRPNNEWWNTDIKNDLKNCHALVTNMSLSAIDAVLNKVPAFTHDNNIASAVSSRNLKYIEKPMKPGQKTMNGWLNFVAENQFTVEEIERGLAYKTLMDQQNI